jgi:hypothetical protein
MSTTKQRDSPCPSIVKMWVLLEGSPSPLKLRADITNNVSDLDYFKVILSSEFKVLKDVEPYNIVFLDNNNMPIRPGAKLQDLAEKTTDENPLVVRYPISDVNSK